MMDGYRLFRRDRQGRRGGAVALYVREELDCMMLTAGNDKVETLWVRMKVKANTAEAVVGSCINHPARMMTPMNYSTRN